MTEMTVAKAWDYAIGLIKVDGLEPTEDFKKYIELEKQGKTTTQDLKKYLDKKYKAKGEADVRTALVAYNALFSDIGDKAQKQYLEMIIRDGIETGRV